MLFDICTPCAACIPVWEDMHVHTHMCSKVHRCCADVVSICLLGGYFLWHHVADIFALMGFVVPTGICTHTRRCLYDYAFLGPSPLRLKPILVAGCPPFG